MSGMTSLQGIFAMGALALVTVAGAAETLRIPEMAVPAYVGEGQRDPFVQPRLSRLSQGMAPVDIASLKLTGIMRNPRRTTALFTSQTGPQFGYLLKDGRLYGENHQPVQGITGEVRNPKEVVLEQDGRQIVFRLPG